MKELIKAIIGFAVYIASIGLAWYWYDWKLVLIIFLAIGSVSSDLQEFKRSLTTKQNE